jgi:thioesterase DpgC
MSEELPATDLERCVSACGFSASELRALSDARAALVTAAEAGDFQSEAAGIGRFCRSTRALLERLPPRSMRSAQERLAGESIVRTMADLCWRFFGDRRNLIYDQLTDRRRRALRVEELASAGAGLLPGVLPGAEELARDSTRMLKDKDGLELHQALFFSQLLSDRAIGLHLCAAMLRPTPAAVDRLEEFERLGALDLGPVRIEARGEVGYLTFRHLRYLNAEDDETLAAQEIACDLILLHPKLRLGVLRGDAVDHPRYRGRRIFSAGLNLTRLYHGKLSFMFYLVRDLGLVNKLYRGIVPDEAALAAEQLAVEPEQTQEKPWLAVVDGFAIGGGCQLLLVMDYVIAESGSYCSLPARKEGIIPGCANLRLPRCMGERMARQAIMFDRTLYVDSPEAHALVNEVCSRERLDAAVEDCVRNAVGSGMVSAGGNRKALRVAAEPLDAFRAYMATYAREQGWCHRSEQLIDNLERHWRAADRQI